MYIPYIFPFGITIIFTSYPVDMNCTCNRTRQQNNTV